MSAKKSDRTKRKQTEASTAESDALSADSTGDNWFGWTAKGWRNLSALLLAIVCVLAMVMPTESAAESGSDLPRVILVLLIGAFAFWSSVRFLSKSEHENSSETSNNAPLNWIDILVLGFALWHTLSCGLGVMWQTCEPRPAFNLMWQQLSFVVLYGIARVSLRARRPIFLWQSFVVAGGLLAAFYGWYQYWIELPNLHQSYLDADEADKIRMLLQAGVTEPESGSRLRQLFESRLFNREPFAFFTLANSLAGLLVPLVLLAFAEIGQALKARDWKSVVIWAFAWAVMASTLVLTSSRTAILTVSLLSTLWMVYQWRGGWFDRRVGRFVVGSMIIVPVLLAVILWVTGASDSRLLSSAPATIRYRLEYWVSSFQMTADHPWIGCGPGSFQSAYARYQLPTASETIADPHNFLVEWMATAGVPAWLLMITGLLATLVLVFRNREAVGCLQERAKSNLVATSDNQSATGKFSLVGSLGLIVAVLIGLVAGWLFGFMPSSITAVLVCLLCSLSWWIAVWMTDNGRHAAKSQPVLPTEGNVPERALLLAWLGVMLHLMASGGINYPAIGQFYFLLMGALVGSAVASSPSGSIFEIKWSGLSSQRPALGVGVSVGLLVLSGYLYLFQLSPLVKSGALMSRLGESQQMGQGQQLLRQLLREDPWNSEAAYLFAANQLQQQAPQLADPKVQRATEEAILEALVLEPYSSPAREAVANLYLQLTELEFALGDESLIKIYLKRQAKFWLQAASDRKPTDSRILAKLSWISWELGETTRSLELANSAQHLDDLIEHADLQLEQLTFEIPLESASHLKHADVWQDRQSNRLNAGKWCKWVVASVEVAPK